MLRMNLGVAVGKDKQAMKSRDAPRKKFYKIYGGFICPMNILKYNEGWFFLIF